MPAIALLLVTLVALMRLFGLRGRAQVLVDPVWLSALAHAQRRMGFKNGTALLTSSELSSPISWGLMRPVILLNDEALGASGEAEAIIAHELAHVARLDWAKLMLARVATAIFWFNPLAWALAREAHQLREEAADDAVLAADIADTDYAQLLVGVARHECKGMLLGAHGISPGKGSLTRRVRRVLDTSLARAPGGRSWVAGFAAGMLVMAAPLAALTFAPASDDTLSDADVADAETVTARADSFAAVAHPPVDALRPGRHRRGHGPHFADRAAAARSAPGRRKRAARQQWRQRRHPGQWHDSRARPERRDGHRPCPRRQRPPQDGHAQRHRIDLYLCRCPRRAGDEQFPVRDEQWPGPRRARESRASSTARSRSRRSA